MAFANIDEQLLLWVDGTPVTFDSADDLRAAGQRSSAIRRRTIRGDLAPAGIGSQSGVAASQPSAAAARHLLHRRHDDGPVADYAPQLERLLHMSYRRAARVLVDARSCGRRPGRQSPFDERREAIFPLAADQFFMLGDNSPLSQDARLWDDEKLRQPRVADRQGPVHLLAAFVQHACRARPIPFPFFPELRPHGVYQVKSNR